MCTHVVQCVHHTIDSEQCYLLIADAYQAPTSVRQLVDARSTYEITLDHSLLPSCQRCQRRRLHANKSLVRSLDTKRFYRCIVLEEQDPISLRRLGEDSFLLF